MAFRGIDRYCERDNAKAGRRRPIRIEFCEADVLDAFDDWRRAVGVVGVVAEEESAASASRKAALATHIDGAIARLRAFSARDGLTSELVARIESAVTEMESLAAESHGARGEKRARIVGRLGELDRELSEPTIERIQPERAQELRREAETELAPFRSRMSADAHQRALEAAYLRLVRHALGVPTLAYE